MSGQTTTAQTAAEETTTFGARLRAPGARYWYIGGGSGLLWQSILVVTVLLGPLPIAAKVAGLALLAVLYAVFMLLGPLVWPESTRTTLIATVLYWVATGALFPVIGPDTIWVWLLVVSIAAFTRLPLPAALIICGVVVAVQLAIALIAREPGLVFAPIITGVGAATFLGLGFITRSNQDLRLAHSEIARLAVVEERARFGRDLHDVLGHSLTVVTVKADLARRLVKIDPDRAEHEIAEIEQLTRSALADLRVAVANYRDIALDSELIAARTALAAAGIRAHLPDAADAVDPRLQGVFAWVLREGVTNVIRHSGASGCWVSLAPDRLTVSDNGRGAATAVALTGDGNGLRGLRERTEAVRAVIEVGRSRHGGFELTARAVS